LVWANLDGALSFHIIEVDRNSCGVAQLIGFAVGLINFNFLKKLLECLEIFSGLEFESLGEFSVFFGRSKQVRWLI
jgi:hypothetical protein